MNLSDQELEHWAAERVMGWQLVEMQPADNPVMVWIDPNKEGHECLQSEWHSLTNLNHCFMVVDRMKELGWHLAATGYRYNAVCEPLWYAHFIRFQENGNNYHVLGEEYGKHPAKAIHAAAWEALEGGK